MSFFSKLQKKLPEHFNEAGDIPTACCMNRNPPPTLKLRGGGHLSVVINSKYYCAEGAFMANHTIEVYESIKDKIHKGEYSPSESLREQYLADQYGVSRNTIRKSLLLLEKEGLVTIEINKGARVRAYSLKEVLDYLELRAQLEGFIIRKAVPVFSEEQISKLEEMLNLMKKHYDNNELIQYSQCNLDFHQIIYDACPNRTAVDMTVNLKNQMRKYNTKTILIPGRSSQSFDEHSAILEAIKKRDDELAEVLMLRHVNSVRRIFQENYPLLF